MKKGEKKEVAIEKDDKVDASVEAPKKKLSRKERRKNKKKLYEFTPDNDIKYRGPFSYRHLRIFGWVFFAISQIAVILSLGGKVDPDIATNSNAWINVLSVFKDMMMPLFLLANFSFILRSENNYRKLIIKFTGLSLLFAALYYLIYEHYIVGFLTTYTGDRASARDALDTLFLYLNGGGTKSLNVFLDLLLCTLLFFFLMYHPKKYFQGKHIIWFRLLALLPIVYEVVSIFLKFFAARGMFAISPYAYPFFTCKPPMTFVAFIGITLFFKFRKKYLAKHDVKGADYSSFLKTNANSWQVSKVISIIFVIAAILDIVIYVILLLSFFARQLSILEASGAVIEEIDEFMALASAFSEVQALGFGGAVSLLLVIPFTLLFSYTKEHKDNKIDMFIPMAGLALVAFVYLEGLFQLSKMVPSLFERLLPFKKE